MEKYVAVSVVAVEVLDAALGQSLELIVALYDCLIDAVLAELQSGQEVLVPLGATLENVVHRGGNAGVVIAVQNDRSVGVLHLAEAVGKFFEHLFLEWRVGSAVGAEAGLVVAVEPQHRPEFLLAGGGIVDMPQVVEINVSLGGPSGYGGLEESEIYDR